MSLKFGPLGSFWPNFEKRKKNPQNLKKSYFSISLTRFKKSFIYLGIWRNGIYSNIWPFRHIVPRFDKGVSYSACLSIHIRAILGSGVRKWCLLVMFTECQNSIPFKKILQFWNSVGFLINLQTKWNLSYMQNMSHSSNVNNSFSK